MCNIMKNTAIQLSKTFAEELKIAKGEYTYEEYLKQLIPGYLEDIKNHREPTAFTVNNYNTDGEIIETIPVSWSKLKSVSDGSEWNNDSEAFAYTTAKKILETDNTILVLFKQIIDNEVADKEVESFNYFS